jgi:hypothetical protein
MHWSVAVGFVCLIYRWVLQKVRIRPEFPCHRKPFWISDDRLCPTKQWSLPCHRKPFWISDDRLCPTRQWPHLREGNVWYTCRFVFPRRKEREGILFLGWSPVTTNPQDKSRTNSIPSFDLVHLTCPGHRSSTLFL